jgi:hypothetical protein
MHWLAWLLASIALYAGAALLSARPAQSPAAMLRAVARPLVLPVLWSSFARAQRQATPGEIVERGRLLLRFLPRWTDGHVHLASQLAFEASLRAGDPESALDRLEAALVYLGEFVQSEPDKSASVLEAMAFFIEARTLQDPALAAAFRERFGIEPSRRAEQYLRRAQAGAPRESLTMRLVFHGLSLVEERIEARDLAGAGERLDGILGILAEPAEADARALRSELEALKAWLHGEPKTSLEPLRNSRFRQVERIAELLRPK